MQVRLASVMQNCADHLLEATQTMSRSALRTRLRHGSNSNLFSGDAKGLASDQDFEGEIIYLIPIAFEILIQCQIEI